MSVDVLTRDRVLRLAGVTLPGVEARRMPYPGQHFKHGWLPVALDPVEVLTPDALARDYGDELDRVDVGDVSVVARSEGTLTVEADAGGQDGEAVVFAAPSPSEAQDWADYIDDGLDLDVGESTAEHGLTVSRTADGLSLRWPEGDEDTDPEDLDGVDLAEDEVAGFTQALRDMAYVTEDNQTVPEDEGAADVPEMEMDTSHQAAVARHRTLELLGIEVRAFDTAKHPHYAKGVAGSKGGQFRPIAAQIGDALKSWLAGGGHDADPLKGFSQPQLKKAAEQLGLNPPKGMRLVPLKGLLMQHAQGGKTDVPGPTKPTPQTTSGVPTPAEVAAARTKLERGIKMHGSDRSKWPARQRQEAARLDKIIAAGTGADVPDVPPVKAAAKKAARGTTKPDPASIAAELKSASSIDEASRIMAGLGHHSKAQHQAVADALGVEYRPADSIDSLKQAIIRQAVTRRLEHEAYLKHATPVSATPGDGKAPKVKATEDPHPAPDVPGQGKAQMKGYQGYKGAGGDLALGGAPKAAGAAAGKDRVDEIDRRQREITGKLLAYSQHGPAQRVRLFKEQQELNAEREKLIASGVPDPNLQKPADEEATRKARERIATLRHALDYELGTLIQGGRKHTPEEIDLQQRIEAVNELHRTANRLDPAEIDKALARLRKPGGSAKPAAKRAPKTPAGSSPAPALPAAVTNRAYAHQLTPDDAFIWTDPQGVGHEVQIRSRRVRTVTLDNGQPGLEVDVEGTGADRGFPAQTVRLGLNDEIQIVDKRATAATPEEIAGFKAAKDWRNAVIPRTVGGVDVSFPPEITPTLLPDSARQARAEADTRAAVKAIAGDGEWVRLPAVRDALQAKGYSREEQDAALLGLATQPDVHIVKIANLKSLSSDDRRAAVYIGGEHKTAIMVGASSESAPSGRPAGMSETQRQNEITALTDQLRLLTPGTPEHTRIQAEIDRLGGGTNGVSEDNAIATAVAGLTDETEISIRIKGLGLTAAVMRRLARDMGIAVPTNLRAKDAIQRFIAGQIAQAAIPGGARSQILDPEQRHRVLAMATRAAGQDITPGHDQLHHYWTRGEGLAKWRDSPHPWTTLRDHLLKYVSPHKAVLMASKWFEEVFGYTAGSDLHRLDSGKPPRGKLVGPG